MTRTMTALVCSLLVAAAAPEQLGGMQQTTVTASCVINGTQIAMRYQGTVYTSSRSPPEIATMALLEATDAERERSAREMSRDDAVDYSRFGASRLRAPWSVTLRTLEPRGDGRWNGYGFGDAEMSASGHEFNVPVDCVVQGTH